MFLFYVSSLHFPSIIISMWSNDNSPAVSTTQCAEADLVSLLGVEKHSFYSYINY